MSLTVTDVSNEQIGALAPMVGGGFNQMNHHRDAQGEVEATSLRALSDEISPFADTAHMRDAADVVPSAVKADELSKTVLNRVDEIGNSATASVGTGVDRLATLGNDVAGGVFKGGLLAGALLAGSFKGEEDEEKAASIWDVGEDANGAALPMTDMECAVAQACSEVDMKMLANEMHFSTVEKQLGYDVNHDGVNAAANSHLPNLVGDSSHELV